METETIVWKCGLMFPYTEYKSHYVKWDFLNEEFKKFNKPLFDNIKQAGNIQEWKNLQGFLHFIYDTIQKQIDKELHEPKMFKNNPSGRCTELPLFNLILDLKPI